MNKGVLILASMGIALLSVPVALHAQKTSYRQADIDNGALIYQAQCSRCHGAGDGVPNVDLRTGQFRHGSTDQDLLAIIRNGISGTAMPAHPELAGNDILSVVAYLRNMRDYNSEAVKLGDAHKGKVVFEGAGKCSSCHRVNGMGSRIAPDLSDTGTLHPAAYLKRALLDPSATKKEQPQNRYLHAVTKSGKEVTGLRLNEDTFTVQLIDSEQNLVSLEKLSLRSLTVVPGSAMPSYGGKLTPTQIDDLVAYLASLQKAGAVIPLLKSAHGD